MGAEQILIRQGVKALPEAEGAATKIITEVVEGLDEQTLLKAAKGMFIKDDDPFASAGAKLIVVGDKEALPQLSLDNAASKFTFKPGPVWNEEALYHQATRKEMVEPIYYGWQTPQEQRAFDSAVGWLKDTGFTNERFTGQTISKTIETGQVLPTQVMTRLQSAAHSGNELPRPLATHFYRNSSGNIQQYDVFNINDASTLLNYSPNTIRSLASKHAIPGHKVDGAHGEEWRVLLPSVRNRTGSSLSAGGQETEETLFRKLADGDPYDDPFRYVFHKE